MTTATDAATLQHYKTLEVRFDRAARLYDATYGPADEQGHGNPLMDWLRAEHLSVLRDLLPAEASVLDIGCGTGEEALALVRDGYSVLGIDISPAMIRQAQTKAAVHGVQRGFLVRALAAGQLASLDERGPFRGAYSSLGTLNTEPDLPAVAQALHALLEPGAPFVATVMSRRCLFEIVRGARRLAPRLALDRSGEWAESRAGAGGVVAPVRFYTPGEFAAPFSPYFAVESVRAFPLWLPPVHLHELYRAASDRYARAKRWDTRMRSWPGFRAWGDHFLMVLRHAAAPGSTPPAPDGAASR